MNTMASTITTTGSTLRPGVSSAVYSLSMVLELPPAPAALVDMGLSLFKAEARRLMELDPLSEGVEGREDAETSDIIKVKIFDYVLKLLKVVGCVCVRCVRGFIVGL